MSRKPKELSEIVEKSRQFYDSLKPRERSLINVCREGYDGSYCRFIYALRRENRRRKSLDEDIASLKKIYDFIKRYHVDLYMMS
jgi:hypothetical protein